MLSCILIINFVVMVNLNKYSFNLKYQAKQEATEKMEDAKEEGDMEEALKQKLRTTYITQTMKEDAIKMLELMGVPVIKVNRLTKINSFDIINTF